MLKRKIAALVMAAILTVPSTGILAGGIKEEGTSGPGAGSEDIVADKEQSETREKTGEAGPVAPAVKSGEPEDEGKVKPVAPDEKIGTAGVKPDAAGDGGAGALVAKPAAPDEKVGTAGVKPDAAGEKADAQEGELKGAGKIGAADGNTETFSQPAEKSNLLVTSLDDLSAILQKRDPDEYILQEGSVPATIFHYYEYEKGEKSMADRALVKPLRIIRTNKGYRAIVTFQGVTIMDKKGYLGKLYALDPADPGQADKFKELEAISYHDVIDLYNDPVKGIDPQLKGKKYPKEFIVPVRLTADYELLQVYVPIMEGIQAGNGTQKARLLADGSQASWGALYKKSLTDRLDKAGEIKQEAKGEAAFKALTEAIKAGREAVEAVQTPDALNRAIQAIDKAVKDFKEAPNSDPGQYSRYVRLKVTGLAGKELEQPAIQNLLDDLAEIVKKEGEYYLRLTYFSKAENEAGYDSGSPRLEYSDQYIAEDNKSQRTALTGARIVESGHFDGPYELAQVDIPLKGRTQFYLYGYFKTLNTPNAPRWERCAIVSWENSAQTLQTELPALKLLNVKQGRARLIDQTEATRPLDFQGKDGRWYSPYRSKDGNKFFLPADPGKSETEINLSRDSFVTGGLRRITYTIDGTEPSFDGPAAELKSLNKDSYLPDKFYRISLFPAQLDALPKTGGQLRVKLKGFSADGKQSTQTVEVVIPYQAETVDTVAQMAKVPDSTFTLSADTNRNFALQANTRILAEVLTEEEMVSVIQGLVEKTGARNPHILRIALVGEDGAPADLMFQEGWKEPIYPLARLIVNVNNKNINAKDLAIFEYSFGQLRQISAGNNFSSKYLRANISQPEGYYVIAELNNAEQNRFALDRLNKAIESAKAYVKGTSDQAILLQHAVEEARTELARSGKRKPRTGEMLALANRIEELVALVQQESADPSAFDFEKARTLISLAEQPLLKEFLSKNYQAKLSGAAADLKAELDKGEGGAVVAKTEALQALLDKPESRYPERRVELKMLKQKNDSQSMSDNVFADQALLVEGTEANYLLLDLKTLIFGNIRGHLLKLTMHQGELDQSAVYPVAALNKMVDLGMHGKKSLFDSKIVVRIDKEVKEIYQVRVDSDAMSGANPSARMKLTWGELVKALNRTDLAQALADARQLKQGKKSAEAFTGLQAAIEAAAHKQADAQDQDQLDETLAELKRAIAEFKASPDEKPVDRSGLKRLLRTVSELVTGDYTEASWKILAEAEASAESLLQNETATADQLAEAEQALAKALAGLEKVLPAPPQKQPEIDPAVPTPNSWTVGGKNEHFVIKVTAPLENLLSVSVDGKVLAKEDYIASSGSTVVELKKAYLDGLKPGSHTLTVHFKAGGSFTAGEVSHAFEVLVRPSAGQTTTTSTEPSKTTGHSSTATTTRPSAEPGKTTGHSSMAATTRPSVEPGKTTGHSSTAATTRPPVEPGKTTGHSSTAATTRPSAEPSKRKLARTGEGQTLILYSLGLFLVAGAGICLYRKRVDQ